MPQGDYTAKIGSQSLPVKLASDHYYTIVNNTSGAPQLVEEPPFKNKQKSLVRVQNLSDKSLTLKTADGKTDVVKAVAAKGTGEREINPVKVSFALFDGDKKVSDLKPVALERGEAAVLYVTGSGSSLSPVWVKRPTATQ
jgi:alginate O-acetyltransferase complex protein AlgF